MNVGLVCLMGVSIVFIGLLCIVLLCTVMSRLVMMSEKDGDAPIAEAKGQPVKLAAPASAPADVRPAPEVVAAISAAIAEELGESASAFRILHIKKI